MISSLRYTKNMIHKRKKIDKLGFIKIRNFGSSKDTLGMRRQAVDCGRDLSRVCLMKRT